MAFEWSHSKAFSTLYPELRLDEPSSLTPTALLGFLPVQLSSGTAVQKGCGKTRSKQSCHYFCNDLFKEVVTAGSGVGKDSWMARTALLVLRYPAHLEKKLAVS